MPLIGLSARFCAGRRAVAPKTAHLVPIVRPVRRRNCRVNGEGAGAHAWSPSRCSLLSATRDRRPSWPATPSGNGRSEQIPGDQHRDANVAAMARLAHHDDRARLARPPRWDIVFVGWSLTSAVPSEIRTRTHHRDRRVRAAIAAGRVADAATASSARADLSCWKLLHGSGFVIRHDPACTSAMLSFRRAEPGRGARVVPAICVTAAGRSVRLRRSTAASAGADVVGEPEDTDGYSLMVMTIRRFLRIRCHGPPRRLRSLPCRPIVVEYPTHFHFETVAPYSPAVLRSLRRPV